jgi:hypothetical protein
MVSPQSLGGKRMEKWRDGARVLFFGGKVKEGLTLIGVFLEGTTLT